MSRIRVWDLVVRSFHWLFAGGVIAAAAIAFLLGEHSRLFPYHALIGLTLALMVVLRVVWGAVGTRHARFGSFVFGPRALLAYFRSGGKGSYTGHNPASAWAIFAMLGLMLGLAVTGVMMGRGYEGAKDVHELMAYGLIGIAAVHILGVAVHALRWRDGLVASMVSGYKHGSPDGGIRSAQPWAAAVFLTLTGLWAGGLLRNFSPSTQSTRLPLVGTSLALGEVDHDGDVKGDHEPDDE